MPISALLVRCLARVGVRAPSSNAAVWLFRWHPSCPGFRVLQLTRVGCVGVGARFLIPPPSSLWTWAALRSPWVLTPLPGGGGPGLWVPLELGTHRAVSAHSVFFPAVEFSLSPHRRGGRRVLTAHRRIQHAHHLACAAPHSGTTPPPPTSQRLHAHVSG